MSHSHGKTRVALIFGGRSSEHEVSCATAASVLDAIDRDRYDVLPIGISRSGQWVLMPDDPDALRLTVVHRPSIPERPSDVLLPVSPGKAEVTVLEQGGLSRTLGEVDVVFPLLHGAYGEDGTLQGMLEMADIPYVGCGVTASAVMMDKIVMKQVFAHAGLSQLPWESLTDREWRQDSDAVLARIEGALQLPVFVKPARAGSSVGVVKVSEWEDLRDAIETARAQDPRVVVEQGCLGIRELECGVLDSHGGVDSPRVAGPGEVVVGADFYDFDDKYLNGASTVQIPADVPADVAQTVRRMALIAYEAAGCEGLSRCDFFLAPDGQIHINEINTLPGFTPISMYPKVWAHAGISYSELIDELITLALERPIGLR